MAIWNVKLNTVSSVKQVTADSVVIDISENAYVFTTGGNAVAWFNKHIVEYIIKETIQ